MAHVKAQISNLGRPIPLSREKDGKLNIKGMAVSRFSCLDMNSAVKNYVWFTKATKLDGNKADDIIANVL